MKDRFVTELDSYIATLKEITHFYYDVHLKGGTTISSSLLPVDAIQQALEDLSLLDEGFSLPIWNRNSKELVIIPAREISFVQINLREPLTTVKYVTTPTRP